MGPDGAEMEEVSRRDIFRKNEQFAVIVEASNAQDMSSIQDKTAKINFLASQVNNQKINQQKAYNA